MITNNPKNCCAQHRQQAQHQYAPGLTTVTGTQAEPEALTFLIPEVLLYLHTAAV